MIISRFKQSALHLFLTTGVLTVALATSDPALAQKTPSTPIPTAPAAAPSKPAASGPTGTPATDSALNQAPKTPSTPTPTPAAQPGQPATGTTVIPADSTKPAAEPAATETPATLPAAPGTPVAVPVPVKVAPIDLKAVEIPKDGKTLDTRSEMPIAPNPAIDGLFTFFNYASIAALGGAIVFGTMWYFRHKKRIALGLTDDDDDDDDDYDDDELVTGKVTVVETKSIESKNELPSKNSNEVEGKAVEVVESQSDQVAIAEVKNSEQPANNDTASDAESKSEIPEEVAQSAEHALATDAASSGGPAPASSSSENNKSGSSKSNKKKSNKKKK